MQRLRARQFSQSKGVRKKTQVLCTISWNDLTSDLDLPKCSAVTSIAFLSSMTQFDLSDITINNWHINISVPLCNDISLAFGCLYIYEPTIDCCNIRKIKLSHTAEESCTVCIEIKVKSFQLIYYQYR